MARKTDMQSGSGTTKRLKPYPMSWRDVRDQTEMLRTMRDRAFHAGNDSEVRKLNERIRANEARLLNWTDEETK